MAANKTKTSAAFEKKVRAAIAQLEVAGEKITNAKVREKTGGSFRDLSPIVKAVLAEQEARALAESQVPPMPDEISVLADALWEGAYRHADQMAAAERRAHAEELKDLRRELSEREDEVGLVEDERDAALVRAKAAEAGLLTQAAEIQALKVRIAGLEGRLQGRLEGAGAAPEASGAAHAADGEAPGLEVEDAEAAGTLDSDPDGDPAAAAETIHQLDIFTAISAPAQPEHRAG